MKNTAPKKTKTYPVVKCFWEESESGWGCRPDGYSLHLTIADRDAYVKDYWDTMPDSAPSEYSRPSNMGLVDVDAKTYNKIKKSKNGIRVC